MIPSAGSEKESVLRIKVAATVDFALISGMDRDELIAFLQTLPADVLILGAVAEDGGLEEVGWDLCGVVPNSIGGYNKAREGQDGRLAVVFE